MFDSLKSELTRRNLLYKAGFGLIAVSTFGAVGTIFKPTRSLAQAEPAPTKEPSLPPEKKLGWAVVGLGKFATDTKCLQVFGSDAVLELDPATD
ncbi:hypothetical protein [Nostoc sp. MG11]|uniref:hypothetical protein n=1 Tax=Nostoc sp. MG11 TaxID=2721166 RepID=UPI001D02DF14|nr:hypothetical protein [Nostoc sp. MG11]